MKHYTFSTIAAVAAVISLASCENDETINLDSFVTSDNTVVTFDENGGELSAELDWSNMYLEVCKADVPEWLEVEIANAPERVRTESTGTCQVVFKAKGNHSSIRRSARVRVGSMALNTAGHAPEKYYVLFDITQSPVTYVKEDVGPATTENGNSIYFNYAGASYQFDCVEHEIDDEGGIFFITETSRGVSIVRKSARTGEASFTADGIRYKLISK